MKYLMTLSLLATISITNSFAGVSETRIPIASVSLIALSVYEPHIAASVGGTGVIFLSVIGTEATKLANQQRKDLIKKMVNADVQEFYNNGKITEELAQTIKLIKQDTDLSDAEALDILVKSINE